ncbi:MAG: cytochrome c, mono- and diheme variant family [Labilithrix sp.]|nr:cytochrome c, mono- and diheme variant family [Labilithrix sp.]
MSRLLFSSVFSALLLTACPKTESTSPPPSTDASAAEAATPLATTDGKSLVATACLSCHSEQMLAQQRLTQAQWQKVVTKMVGWGANLDPSEVAPLVAYLSSTSGPDAGPYIAETIPASEALAELAPLPDPVPPGDPVRGKSLFIDKCSGCHGQDARGAPGALGVLLVDRPFLHRFADVAKTIRKGRGKMLPLSLSDTEIADILAHLRSLKPAAPAQ